jgi:CSLREA domain-containing protein
MNKKHFLLIPLIGIMVGISYLSYSFINHAQAAGPISVNSNLDTVADDGFCTLREAIENANDTVTGDPHGFVTPGECTPGNPGTADTIDFSITGTITSSGFYTITEALTIDGTTAPGASCDFAARNLPVVVDGGPMSLFQINTSDVVIKGMTLQSGNVAINSTGTNNISVLCNNIGTDVTGSGNSVTPGNRGITFSGVTNSFIGQAGMGNVIGNQNSNGVYIVGNSNTFSILGNRIGVNAFGTVSLDNHVNASGINIQDSSNITIGAVGAGNENVISGFDGDINSTEGVVIYHSDHIIIKNNFIGTDITGTIAIPNGQQGIEVCGPTSCGGGIGITSDLIIGGSNPGEGNVISGNTGDGITTNGVNNITILGNKIGTDISGLLNISNSNHGIGIGRSDNIFISENIISGNDTGINMSESNAGIIVKNTIGFLADGVTAAGNTLFGILVFDSDNVHIGSTNNADRNYIGNSGFAGIFSANSGSDIRVIKNNIGVGIDDLTPAPNGVGIVNFNLGSGSLLVQENLIKNSLTDGVLIGDSTFLGPIPPTSGNVSVIKNSISNNGGLGINMAQDFDGDTVFEIGAGVNLNDISDSDSGPNNYLNYPALYTITPNGPNYDVTFSADVPNNTIPGVSGYYHVEFFKSSSADPSSHGEGETYIGSQDINVNPLLGVPYYGTYTTTVPLAPGDVISPTITECTDATCTAFRSTSEFGSDVTVLGGTTALDYGSAPDTGTPRSATSYPTYTVSNGAYHIIDPATYLGSCIDADSGTAAPFGTSPLTIGACTNDNDGITFPSSMLFGSTHVIPVTAHGAGVLNVWVDWNQNGDFENSERIATNTAMVNGANTFSLTVPAGVGSKITYARIRFTSDASKVQQLGGSPSPYGEALDGEVEDYILNLTDGAVIIPPSSGGGSSSGGIISTCRDPKASNYQTVGTHNPLLCTYSSTPTAPKTTTLVNTGTPTTLDQKACPYFTQYLKKGAKNSKAEVTKWQHFLNDILGLKLKVNGTYDTATVNAVNQFQTLFASDILIPWGLKGPTGYTYKTTRMKANQMVNCLESSVTLEGSGQGKTWVLPALK